MRSALIIGTLATLLLAPAIPAQEQAWITDYAKALELSEQTGKPVLADFTGSDWCGWCIKLHEEVFDTTTFAKWAQTNVILLELDFPRDKEQGDTLKEQNKALLKRYGVKGFPTILFLDGDGGELGRSGYKAGGPQVWIDDAARIMKGEEVVEAEIAEATWLTDWKAATKLSKETGRPLLVDFTGSDWCGWCIKLHEEVFDTAAFAKWAKENVILVELDFPKKKTQSDELKAQNKELIEKYGVRGFPTILLLDHAGQRLGESGYKPGGPKTWIADAQKQLDDARKKREQEQTPSGN